ncbi:MAG: hypothetical protein EP330_12790 [Deltaproteobacteria bacterium]|nr:MAG: hypothetical protein EP330_12790 [Deltaproteobacteria bacterium]
MLLRSLLVLLALPTVAYSQELSRKECRDRLDAFYAEPARACSPSADPAQTARVAATQGRSDKWKAFFAKCEQAHTEFLAVDAGCEAKFKEGYPNADWVERWGKLEAIDADVDARLLVFGCARDRDPLLDKLTECMGTACTEAVSAAEEWAGRCAPDGLSEEAAGIGYRKNFELLGMLGEEGTARAAHAELVTRVGEAVKGGRADGLQLALAAPWCTDDKSWTCALDVSWKGDAKALITGLRAFRGGELERTRLGRARLTGVRDTRKRLLLERELRPQVLDAAIDTGSAGGESPSVRRTWAGDDRTRALAWQGVQPEAAPTWQDRDAAGNETVSLVHGQSPWAVSFELERSPADVQTALRKVRGQLSEDALVALHVEPERAELVYAVDDHTQVVYVAVREGRDAVLTRVVEHPARAERSAEQRAKAALDGWLAKGELPDAEAFTSATADFGEALSPKLAEAIELHVAMFAATGDKGAWSRRMETLAPQLDLWAQSKAGEPAEEELPEDEELIDPDMDRGPATPRSRKPGSLALAIGGCAETAWAEAAEAADAEAKHWHREATWAELRYAMLDLRDEDTVEAARNYRFAMRQLADTVRQRDEAGRLAGERDAYRLKSGIDRVDTNRPAFALAALLTDAECE